MRSAPVAQLALTALSATLLGGCFTPEAPPFVVGAESFENIYTEFPDIVIEPHTYDLECPDGTPATYYLLYRTAPPGPMPVVVLFHSGSFDYVVSPTPEDPLAGAHYAEGDSRLTGDWARTKVFQTLGLLADDSGEENDGAMPAALANAGVLTVLPANCWGDMWHNESGYEPNQEGEYLARNGRAWAWDMVSMFSADPETRDRVRGSLDFPAGLELEDAGIGLIGLGEGGRAIPELLRRSQFVPSQTSASSVMPPLRGVVLDSTMDNLYPVYVDRSTWGRLDTGLDRLFPDQANGSDTDIGKYSLYRWISDHSVPTQVELVWSSADPVVPATTLQGLVDIANGTSVIALDTAEAGHVFLNADMNLARNAVDRLLGR